MKKVTIPNGNVLANAVVNFSAGAAAGGVVLTVRAGIGYDVDWRTVHRLMQEGGGPDRAHPDRSRPAGLADETSAITRSNTSCAPRPTGRKPCSQIHSTLCRNVLDAFNRAGVEIMTPSILAHRDASGQAIPQEAFPKRSPRRGIAVEVDGRG